MGILPGVVPQLSHRSVLILLLVVAAGGVPILENPGSSLLGAQPRLQHLAKMLAAKGIRVLL